MKKNRTEEEIQQPKKMTSIGGQALMEGLMMIGPTKIAMSVRLPNGQIHTETSDVGVSSKAAKIPLIRGSVKIFQQMVTGTRYLMRSAEFIEEDIEKSGESGAKAADSSDTAEAAVPETQLPVSEPETEAIIEAETEQILETVEQPAEESVEENVPEMVSEPSSESAVPAAGTVLDKKIIKKAQKDQKRKEKEAKGPGKFEQFLTAHSDILLYGSAVVGILMSVGLFILLPNLITNLTIGFFMDKNASIFNRVMYSLVEGVIRIVIFITYLYFASKLKDIERVWMYHGAEHKTIACYESGLPLVVENTRKFSKHHPRCGTAFMFIILIVSIIVFSFVPKINILVDLIIRLACVPVLAGISYEIIHWAARHDNVVTRALSWPGLMLQRLTTKEPDDSMLEVAIAAMVPVIPAGERGDEW